MSIVCFDILDVLKTEVILRNILIVLIATESHFDTFFDLSRMWHVERLFMVIVGKSYLLVILLPLCIAVGVSNAFICHLLRIGKLAVVAIISTFHLHSATNNK